MTQDIEIDGHSRRFQLLVLVAAIGVVLTALIAVGAIANADNDAGFSIGTGSGDGEGSGLFGFGGGESEEPSEPESSSGEHSGNGDSDGSADGEWTGDGSGSDGMRDMLDGSDSNRGLPPVQSTDPRTDQFSVDSVRSFVKDTHFRVDSELNSRTFWRTTTFDQYTGDQLTDTRPPTPENTTALDEYTSSSPGEESTHGLLLEENASQIPVTGDPVDVSILGGADPSEYEFRRGEDGTIIVTDGRGNLSTLPEGTELRVTTVGTGSAQTPTDPRTLDGRYTETPDDLPGVVGETASEVVASRNAETNREKADAVTSWLEENKEYRANATHDASEDAVGAFLTDMEGGHSDYFATTTVMMLREEGVPARVATGYVDESPSSDDDGVGAMDQHTWVEVYTEDEGWVTYDPTPTDTKREVQTDVQAGDQGATEYGVHEDVIGAWGRGDHAVTGGETGQQAGVPNDNKPYPDSGEMLEPPYDISVNPEPTPGAEVTVRVTKDGTPVHGAVVSFNGNSVGRTDPDGTVVAQVPYTDSLTITAAPPADHSSTSYNQVYFSGAAGGAFASSMATQEDNPENSSETYDLPTEISVESDGLVVPGKTLTATFTIDGNPVPGVDVYVDGEFAGRTDSDGKTEIEMPEDVTGGETVTVRVNRDELQSETTVKIAEPSVEVDTGLIALPGTTAEISVVATDGTHEQEVTDQTVTVVDADGNPVASSKEVHIGADGTATVTLPWSNAMEVTTSLYGTETTTTVSGLYYRLGAIVVVLVSLVGTGVVFVYQRGVPADAVTSRFYGVLFAVAGWLHRFGAHLYAVIVQGYRKFRVGLRNVWRRLTRRDLRGAVRYVLETPIRAVKRFVAFLRSIPERLAALFTASADGDGEVSNNPPGTAGNSSAGTTSQDLTSYDRIRSCWRWLVRNVIGRAGRTTKTTVEIGEAAINRGFPAGPVRRLRRAFQDVEYGFRDPEKRVGEAEDAVENLRRETDDQTEETA